MLAKHSSNTVEYIMFAEQYSGKHFDIVHLYTKYQLTHLHALARPLMPSMRKNERRVRLTYSRGINCQSRDNEEGVNMYCGEEVSH